MRFGDFILNDDLFLNSFKNLEQWSFDFEFFQKAKVVINK